jgi:hypothetical protein
MVGAVFVVLLLGSAREACTSSHVEATRGRRQKMTRGEEPSQAPMMASERLGDDGFTVDDGDSR